MSHVTAIKKPQEIVIELKLELSEREAKALSGLCTRVAGNTANSARGVFDKVRNALDSVGIYEGAGSHVSSDTYVRFEPYQDC